MAVQLFHKLPPYHGTPLLSSGAATYAPYFIYLHSKSYTCVQTVHFKVYTVCKNVRGNGKSGVEGAHWGAPVWARVWCRILASKCTSYSWCHNPYTVLCGNFMIVSVGKYSLFVWGWRSVILWVRYGKRVWFLRWYKYLYGSDISYEISIFVASEVAFIWLYLRVIKCFMINKSN